MFVTFSEVANKNRRRKWAWPIFKDSSEPSEHVDIRLLNMQQTIWEL